ncbi:MAG TPA: ankyrin repeat domain-containing protein [Myxococcaceae bacterium]|nr:ankyrin repeat domain-containing protein [Myxococcaceae bacterium]
MALIEAVQANDLEKVKSLLRSGTDPNELGPGGTTPLIEAARAGRLELCRVLLDRGAEPTWKDEMHESALLKAAAAGHQAVCALLGPHEDQETRDTAQAFLAAYAQTHGAMEADLQAGDSFMRKVASAGAKVAEVLGDEGPKRRMERIERAEKKKR